MKLSHNAALWALRALAGTAFWATVASCATVGYNISWETCGPTAPTDQTFSCDAEGGAHTLVVSFSPPAGVAHLRGVVSDLTLTQASLGDIGDWWRTKTGQCRDGSAIASTSPGGIGACQDPWLGAGIPGMGWLTTGDAYREVWTPGALTTAPNGVAVAEGTEYVAYTITIDDVHTTGPSACGGCTGPVDIRITRFTLVQVTGFGDLDMGFALRDGTVTWQGGSVPVAPPTWGRVKRMYR